VTIIPFNPKLKSDINQIEWIDYSKVHDYFLCDRPSLRIFDAIMPMFFEKYPTPFDWINDDKKENPKHNLGYGTNTTNPLIYILFWIYETNVLEIEEYEDIILNYLKSNITSKYFERFALCKGLISPKDIDKIKNFITSKINITSIYLICIYLRKNFNDITDEELEKCYKLNLANKFCLQNIRINLGISNIVPKRKSRTLTWDELYSHNKFGSIFKEYNKFLKSAHNSSNKSATDNFISHTGTSLKHLMSFMDEYNYEDFTVFESPAIYEELIEFLEETMSPQTVTTYIPKIRTFIFQNVGDEYFPKKKVFCKQFWSIYSRNAKKLKNMSEGLSFSDSRLATEIVRAVLNYEPKNEIEFLSKQFWLIVSTTTVRFKYLLSLDAYDAIQPLPNSPKEAYGVYSKFADKAGNKYGQFPILDKLGTNAIRTLQDRVKKLELKPIYSHEKKCSYVHLFQLTQKPWVLNRNDIYKFFKENILSQIKELEMLNSDDEIRASAHSFRHYLATNITIISKDIEVAQTALGHKYTAMTERYVSTKSSKEAILFKMVDKFQKKEITGKFYLRLVDILTSESTTNDELIKAITTEMKLDEFFQTYGRQLDAGYCFSKEECSNWYACWNCSNFIITKNEINEAIKILAIQILELKKMQQCKDFSYNAPSVTKKFNLISCIIKRLTELNLTEEDIRTMVDNCFNNKDIALGVIN